MSSEMSFKAQFTYGPCMRFHPRTSPIHSSPLLCALEGCLSLAPLSSSFSLATANKRSWQEMEVEKENQRFTFQQAVCGSLYLRQSSRLVALLQWWKPLPPLTLTALVYVDCSNGLSQTLTSHRAWSLESNRRIQDRKKREQSRYVFSSLPYHIEMAVDIP